MNFSDGKYETPPCCSICKGKNMLPDRQSAVTVDWQRIRLQEIVTDENRQSPSTCTFLIIPASTARFFFNPDFGGVRTEKRDGCPVQWNVS